MRRPPNITETDAGWQIDYRLGAKRFRFTYRTRTDAERAASEIYLAQFAPAQPAPAAPLLQVTMFKDAANLHLETVEPEHAASTADRDRCRVEQTLLPAFGERPLHEITAAEIIEYRNRRKQTVAAGTVNRELALMSAIFKTCIDVHGLVTENPVRRVKRLKEVSKEANPLTREEARLLLDAAETPLTELIAVAIFTGLRPGELFHLRWVDVDFEHRFVNVTSRREFVTKTRRSRQVPMNVDAEKALRAAQAYQARLRLSKEGAWQSEFVFANDDTGAALVDIGKSWEAACKKAGVGHRRLYDLRHTFGTWMALAGEDLFSLQRWMGHQSIVTTQRYARHRPANFRGKLDDLTLGEKTPQQWVVGGR